MGALPFGSRGGHDITLQPWAPDGGSVFRNPNIDGDGIVDGDPAEGFSSSQSYWLNLQLRAMAIAGIKIIAIEWGNVYLLESPCLREHVEALIRELNAHPEYDLRFIIAYDPAISIVPGIARPLDHTVKGPWCDAQGGLRRNRFVEDLTYIHTTYTGNPRYFRPKLNGEERPVIYMYGAWTYVLGSTECQADAQAIIWNAKNFGNPTRQPSRFYFIGDLGRRGWAEFQPAYAMFDAATNFGEANIYQNELSPSTVYKTLPQFTADLRHYLLGESVPSHVACDRANRVRCYVSTRVTNETYNMSYVAAMHFANNDTNLRDTATTFRSISGSAAYESQFFDHMRILGKDKDLIRLGAGNFPFGMAHIATWNDYHEGTGIEPSGGRNGKPASCHPTFVPHDPSPEFPPVVNSSTEGIEYCFGWFYIEQLRQSWSTAFYLPAPTSSTWPSTDSSGYGSTRSAVSGASAVAFSHYVFPTSNSYAYASYRNTPTVNGYASQGADSAHKDPFAWKFSVHARIQRLAFHEYRGIVSNRDANGRGWMLMIGWLNRLAFVYHTQHGTIAGIDGNCPGAAITDSQWHRVAATVDASTVRLYIDGTEVCSAGGLPPGMANTSNDITIGNYFPGLPNGFAGNISDVEVNTGRVRLTRLPTPYP